jgi:Aspartyl protease
VHGSSLVRRLAAVVLVGALVAGPVDGAVLDIPFDFSHNAIGIDVTVHGIPLFVLLDTGVDPSVIATARAESLGLKVDRSSGGEASGYGESKSAIVYPTTIDGLAIRGRSFAPIDALTADTTAMSGAYGRDIDGVLGYSFLKDKIVLINYASQRVWILDRAVDAGPVVRLCRTHWSTTIQFLDGDNTPIIPNFHFGSSSGPITLDTGSNGGISLFDRAIESPDVKAALVEQGEIEHAGARGAAKSKTYSFKAPVGFGPFSLTAGQVVVRLKAESPDDKRFANIGNSLFADMKLTILLNYRAKKLTFYGSCPDRRAGPRRQPD